MSGQLRFEVLGPVRAWRGDAELELGSPQQRAILGILLLQEGAVATPEQLVSAVWGESAPRAAFGMVRSYVSRLRRALGDGRPAAVIESIGGGYALPTPPVPRPASVARATPSAICRYAGARSSRRPAPMG